MRFGVLVVAMLLPLAARAEVAGGNSSMIVRSEVEADGRTRLAVYFTEKTPVRDDLRARVEIDSVGVLELPVVVNHVGRETAFAAATTVVALPAQELRARVTIVDASGRAVSEPLERDFLGAGCGLAGQGGDLDVLAPAGAEPHWVADPRAEPLQVALDGTAILRLVIRSSTEGALLRIRFRRPDGSEMFQCISDFSQLMGDRQMMAIGGQADWPARVGLELTLSDAAGHSETRTVEVPVVVHEAQPEPGELGWKELVLVLAVLPFLVGFLVVSVGMRRLRQK